MTPRNALPDSVDGALGDAILGRNSPRRASIVSDGGNLSLGKFGSAVLASFGRSFWMDLHSAEAAPFGISVNDVVESRSEPQMGRIDARGIVAAVKNGQPIGDRAKVQSPREAMRSDLFAVEMEDSVSIGDMASDPLPAFVRCADSNLRPEAIYDRLSFSHVAPPMRKVRSGEGLNALSAPLF